MKNGIIVLGKAVRKRFALVYEQYKDLKKSDPITFYFKIIDIIYDTDTNEPVLIVQVKNKNINFKLKAIEAIKDDDIMQNFSKKDIRNITYLVCEYEKHANVLIESVTFSHQLSKHIFSLLARKSKKHFHKAASELVNDDVILAQMRPQDASKVGYAAATESFYQSKQQISATQESTTPVYGSLNPNEKA